MKTEYHPIANAEDVDEVEWPLPLSVIPNYMGANLCVVEGMSWSRLDDGRIVSLTIHFDTDHMTDHVSKGIVSSLPAICHKNLSFR
jgi:hypothetical protein